MSDQPTLTLDAKAAALIAEALAETLTPPGALLDADQAGRLLGVPASWVLAQARKDLIPHVRLGHYRRFDRDELLAWAASRSRGPRRNGATPSTEPHTRAGEAAATPAARPAGPPAAGHGGGGRLHPEATT